LKYTPDPESLWIDFQRLLILFVKGEVAEIQAFASVTGRIDFQTESDF
jgi:hypothetical protein